MRRGQLPIWLLLLLGFALSVAADEPPSHSSLKPFVMGGVSYLQYHPESYPHRLVRDALQLHGYRMEMRYFPGKRLLSELNRGNVDGDLLRTVDLSQQLADVVRVEWPISGSCAWVYGLEQASLNPANQSRPKLGLYRGTPGGHKMAAAVMPDAQVIQFNSLTQAAKMLENQRVDLIGLVTWQIKPFTQLMQRPVAAYGQFVLPPNYVHLHRRHGDLAKSLVETLRQLQLDRPSPQCELEERFRLPPKD